MMIVDRSPSSFKIEPPSPSPSPSLNSDVSEVSKAPGAGHSDQVKHGLITHQAIHCTVEHSFTSIIVIAFIVQNTCMYRWLGNTYPQNDKFFLDFCKNEIFSFKYNVFYVVIINYF